MATPPSMRTGATGFGLREWIDDADFDAIPANEPHAPPADEPPLVSVLMITLDHASFVAEAIESVLRQQCEFRFELIIGEDCSHDATRAICEAFRERHPGIVRLVTSDGNVGMHRNLARIWHRARGTYVAMCEGDDYWIDPRKLEKQVAFFARHPDFTLCGAFTRRIRREGDAWRDDGIIGPVAVKERYEVADLIPAYSFHTSSVMLRKGVVRFPRWLWDMYCADRPLYLLCAEQGPAGFLPEVMSVYRLHGTGIWSPTGLLDKAAKGRHLFEVLDEYFGGRHRRLIQHALGEIAWSYVAEALATGQVEAGRRLFWLAARHRVAAREFGWSRHHAVALWRLYAPRSYARIRAIARGRGA